MTASSTLRASRPLALIATAVMLVAFAIGTGGWVPVGRTTEPPRPSTAAPKPATDAGRARAEKAGVDVEDVVERVRHRVTPTEDGSGALAAHDERYRARFDAMGFGFTLGDNPSRFGVSLRGVQRGGHDLALLPGAWRGEANVAERGLGSGMTERVTARAGELEWDVVLTHALPGTGALRIEAGLQGLDGVPTRVAGGSAWRFPLSDGQAARMGEMAVKDASGAEVHRALPRIDGDTLRLTVPTAVLRGAQYPLTIDPTVGPERHVGGDPVYGSAALYQDKNVIPPPAVASDGTNFLVVWEDDRRGPGTNDPTDVYGARVSSSGVMLDPAGIPISITTEREKAPAVAWDGSNFLVVWHHSVGAEWDVRAARVTSAGTLLDPSSIAISTATKTQSTAAVAWNGTNFLVVWHDSRAGSCCDIYGARVSGAGSVLDPAGIAISTAVQAQQYVAVAWSGTHFFVAWQDFRGGSGWDVYGARVSGAGSVLDPAGIPISTGTVNHFRPAVASDGTDALVVWTASSAWDIYGARVSGAGVVIDPTPIPVSTAAGEQIISKVAWNGTHYVVVWMDSRPGGVDYNVFGARVSSAGSVLDAAGIPISTAASAQSGPTLAWNGTDFLVVWQDDRSGAGWDTYGARMSSAMSVLDPAGILVSTAANSQTAPAVAWNGTDFLVVWSDTRSGAASPDIYGTRVSGTGTVLDSSGIPISTAANAQSAPAVAWNGTDFLVLWSDSRSGAASPDIYGTRVSGTGTVVDPAGVAISTAAFSQTAPAVAWNGTDFLVVWTDSRSGTAFSDVYGTRVGGAGGVLDPAGIPVSTAANSQSAPALAWNGTDFLVVWMDNRAGGVSEDIYGSRVSTAGSVLEPAGIPVSTAIRKQAQPAVASRRDSFLVVWEDRRSGVDYDIYGAGVSAAGTVAQPAGIPISTETGNQQSPELAVRYHFLVAWRDSRSGTSYDVYATRVQPSGVVEEPGGFLIAETLPSEGAPNSDPAPGVAVTGGPGATWAVAYARFATESPYGANRVFLRSVSPK